MRPRQFRVFEPAQRPFSCLCRQHCGDDDDDDGARGGDDADDDDEQATSWQSCCSGDPSTCAKNCSFVVPWDSWYDEALHGA